MEHDERHARIDLVEQIEGSRIAFLDGEHQSEGNKRFLPARKLLDPQALVVLRVEGDLS